MGQRLYLDQIYQHNASKLSFNGPFTLWSINSGDLNKNKNFCVPFSLAACSLVLLFGDKRQINGFCQTIILCIDHNVLAENDKRMPVYDGYCWIASKNLLNSKPVRPQKCAVIFILVATCPAYTNCPQSNYIGFGRIEQKLANICYCQFWQTSKCSHQYTPNTLAQWSLITLNYCTSIFSKFERILWLCHKTH